MASGSASVASGSCSMFHFQNFLNNLFSQRKNISLGDFGYDEGGGLPLLSERVVQQVEVVPLQSKQ